MKFEEVLPALREGKKIKRKSWGDYGYIKNRVVFDVREIIDEDSVIYALNIGDLLANDWEIVEEKKKVKVRDLTEEQFRNYCRKKTNFRFGENCGNCPFINVSCAGWTDACWIYHKDLYSDKFLNQEIEIEEE